MNTWCIRGLCWLWCGWALPIAHGQSVPSAPSAGAPSQVSAPSAVIAAPSDEPSRTEGDVSLSPESIAAAQARYRDEPSVAAVIAAVLRQQHVDPARVRRLASRARTAAWLPTLRLSARRGQTIDLLAAQSATTDRNSASTGDDLVLEAQLMFDLSKLVWSGQEPRLERELRAEREAVHTLVTLINALYFERRKLQIERDLDGATIEGSLRIAELEGVLDGLSAGVFERARQRRSPALQAR